MVSQHVTAEERKALAALADMVRAQGKYEGLGKAALKPAEDEDALLLLFLRARGNSVTGASEMLAEHLAHRDKYQVDVLADSAVSDVTGCQSEVIQYYYPTWHGGVDRTGRPVGWTKLGAFDIGSVCKHMSRDELRAFHLWDREQMCARMREVSAASRESFAWFTLVIDMSGFSMGLMNRATRDFCEEIMYLDTELFAARVGRVLIINAPFVFAACYALVSPFMSAGMLAKVSVCSSQRASKAALLELIEPSEIPKEYGGTSSAAMMRDVTKREPAPKQCRVPRASPQHAPRAHAAAA